MLKVKDGVCIKEQSIVHNKRLGWTTFDGKGKNQYLQCNLYSWKVDDAWSSSLPSLLVEPRDGCDAGAEAGVVAFSAGVVPFVTAETSLMMGLPSKKGPTLYLKLHLTPKFSAINLPIGRPCDTPSKHCLQSLADMSGLHCARPYIFGNACVALIASPVAYLCVELYAAQSAVLFINSFTTLSNRSVSSYTWYSLATAISGSLSKVPRNCRLE